MALVLPGEHGSYDAISWSPSALEQIIIFARYARIARSVIHDRLRDLCEPQRCKACRDARKNAARGPREFYTAVCAACGGEAKVPFEPKSDRPVYCSECFAKMREQA